MPSGVSSALPAVPTQLELNFGDGTTAHLSVDLPVQTDADGRIVERAKTPRELLGSTRQASQILEVSDETVRSWIEAGILKGFRIGRNYKVDLLHAQRLKDEARARYE
jgi:excisionase family DNA binding protein